MSELNDATERAGNAVRRLWPILAMEDRDDLLDSVDALGLYIDALRAEVERLRADPRLALTHSDLLNASDEALDMAARSPCGPIRDGWVGSADRFRAAADAMEGNDPAE